MRRRLAALVLSAVPALASCRDASPAPAPEFVGSATCRECHEDRHRTWSATSHAHALREADETTVVGAFDGKPVEHAKFTATPYRSADGAYRMRVERRDGSPPVDHRVDRAIGRSMQQAYLTTGPQGDWQLLHLTWNLRESRWQLTGDVLGEISADPGRYDDFRPEHHGFNHGCAGCHATGFDPGWDEATDTYRTRMVEGSVACESCHGPGSAHSARHRRPLVPGDAYEPPERLLQPRDDLDGPGLDALCARCHDNHWFRFAIDDEPRVGPRDLGISQYADGWGFFADGRFSGLQYDSTVQAESRCRTEGGLSCATCHDLHGGRKRAMRFERPDDDAQCTRCHETMGREPEKHSHHRDVRCVDCHMPRLLVGLLAEQRDHSIGVPEPEATARFGSSEVRDACTVCHTERDAAWAAEAKSRWWGPPDPAELARVALVVRLRKSPADVATPDLLRTATDRGARTFFRLTALRTLKDRAGADVRTALVRLLEDPNADVRIAATAAIAERPDPAAEPALRRLLRDPSRVQRVEAAFALARLGVRGDDTATRRAWEDALRMLDRRRVFDDAFERLALIADARGDFDAAARFTSSLERMPPWAAGPRGDVARDVLHRRGRRLLEQGRTEDAARYLRAATPIGVPPPLLAVDLAELAEARGGAAAVSAWTPLLQSPPGPARAIAAWRHAKPAGRGAAAREDLARLAAELRADPASGEWLRRIDSALR